MSAFFVFSKSFRRAVAGGGGLPLPPICPPPSLPPVRWGGGSGERVSAPLITRNCPGPPLPWGGLSGSSEEQLLVARSLSHPEVLAGVVEGDDINKHTPAGTSSQPLALPGPWRLLVARPGDARMLMCFTKRTFLMGKRSTEVVEAYVRKFRAVCVLGPPGCVTLGRMLGLSGLLFPPLRSGLLGQLDNPGWET